jgi:hypothetical protein
MKKEITIGQLLSVGATLLIAMFSGWVTLNNKVSSQGVEIKVLQDNQSKWDRVVERIEAKIDRNNEITTQILIQLQNKKNREQ